MDDTYRTLTVISVDGTELVFDHLFKETTVERFKRIICMRRRAAADAWEGLKLLVNLQEMENDRTLESYSLTDGAIIQAVTSDQPLSRAPSRAGSVAASTARSTAPSEAASIRPQQLQQIQSPIYTPEPRSPPGILRTVFVNDENGRTHSLSDVPLEMDIRDFQGLLAKKAGFDSIALRIIFSGKQFETG